MRTRALTYLTVAAFLTVVLLATREWRARGTPDVTVVFYRADGYRFSQGERDAVQRIADATSREARVELPALSEALILRVQAGSDVIAETGETGAAFAPNVVYWTADPSRDDGVRRIIDVELRRTLLHEFHHLVRGTAVTGTSLVDQIVTEGMATVFEREMTGTDPPWGRYPENVSDWVAELMALPTTAAIDQWMYGHPDGRRWIGYKVGTYLVDEAVRRSGRSAADLVALPTEDVLRLAFGDEEPIAPVTSSVAPSPDPSAPPGALAARRR